MPKKAYFDKVKIVNFGISHINEKFKIINKENNYNPYFLAPEYVSGEIDFYNLEKSDIWSAGVIAFILLCGQPPFSGKTNSEI